jgi:hypothetical protein
MARRYLQYSPPEWHALSWAMQRTHLEGFYAEDLLKRPEPAPLNADMTVPDDIRSLTAAGSGYRAVEAAPAFDIGAMIADLEQQRQG